MKLNILIFSFLVTAFFSCKKDKTPAPTPTGTGIVPSSATSFYAILVTAKFITGSGLSIYSYTSTGALFFSAPSPANNLALQIPVDSALSNGTSLKYNLTSKEYDDTTFSIAYPPVTWKVFGVSPIPSFTYTVPDPMPEYTGYNSLPDSVANSTAVSLSITGLSNASTVLVNISDNAGNNVAKYLTTGSTSITFTASEMAGLSPSPAAVLTVTCFHNNAMNVYGKPMLFVGDLYYSKSIAIH